MRSSKKESDERWLRLLREAYLEKENLETGNRWQEEVMRRIRTARDVGVAPSSSMVFFQFAWKLAPITFLLILALTVVLMGSGLNFGYGGYGVFEVGLDGPEELSLTEMTAG